MTPLVVLKFIVDYHNKIAAAGRRLYAGVGWKSVCIFVWASCWPSSMEEKIVHDFCSVLLCDSQRAVASNRIPMQFDKKWPQLKNFEVECCMN